MGKKQLTNAVPDDDDDDILNASAQAGATTVDGDDATNDDPDAEADSDAGSDTDTAGGADADADADADAIAAVASADDDDDAGTGGDGRFIPKPRFDDVNERRKAAEVENALLRDLVTSLRGNPAATQPAAPAAPPPKPRDFDAELAALNQKYDNGEIEEPELRKATFDLAVEKARTAVAAEFAPTIEALQAERAQAQQARIKVEFDKELKAAIDTFSFLDADGADANQEAINAVNVEYNDLLARGVDAPKALKLAVRAVAPDYAGDTAKPKTPESIAAARARQAVSHAAAAEMAQPPNAGGIGSGKRTTGKQTLSTSTKDHDKWEQVPEAQRDEIFVAQ